MKCTNCGFEAEQDMSFCPACGTPVVQTTAQTAAQPITNFAGDRILAALKDPMYLIICVLISVSAVLGVLSGSIPVIEVLLTIFMWLVYADATKNTVNVGRLRNISGTVYANYVITYVALGIIGVAGVLIGVLLMVGLDGVSVYDFVYTIEGDLGVALQELLLENYEIISIIGIIIAVVVLAIVVVGLVFNIVGYRKFHRLAKSVYQSVEAGDLSLIQNPSGAVKWMWFFGIVSGLSALDAITSDIIAAIPSVCSASALIIAAIMVKKYLIDEYVAQ